MRLSKNDDWHSYATATWVKQSAYFQSISNSVFGELKGGYLALQHTHKFTYLLKYKSLAIYIY